MIRLEEENHNTKEFYNKCLVEHFESSGLDYDDVIRVNLLLNVFSFGKLLDVGCGVSPLCVEAAKYEDSEVWGIDFSDDIIKLLKKNYPQVNYKVADFYDLPFKDEYFDTVILGEVIEHSEVPEDLVKEAFRVLREGGTMAISTPNRESEGNHNYRQHIWSFERKDIEGLVGKDRILNIFEKDSTIICLVRK